MQYSCHCVALIKNYTGLTTGAYYHNGHFFIGYGHRCDSRKLKITPHDADVILHSDLQEISKRLNELLDDKGLLLTQSQFDAVVALIHDIGIEEFKQSKAFHYLKRHNLQATADHFLDYVYETQNSYKVRYPYLVARRMAQIKLFWEQ